MIIRELKLNEIDNIDRCVICKQKPQTLLMDEDGYYIRCWCGKESGHTSEINHIIYAWNRKNIKNRK